MVLNREQEIALKELEKWLKNKDNTPRGLIGRAGTGKTTLLQYLELPYNTIGVAPTLQAVGVLANSLSCECVSFSSLTFGIKTYKEDKVKFKSNTDRWNKAKKYGLIIIDEASMLSETDVEVLYKIYPNQKILFVGDVGQLPSIDNESFSIFNKVPCYILLKNERSGDNNPILTIANNNYLSENIEIDKVNNVVKDKGYTFIKLEDIKELFLNKKLDTVCVATNKVRERINNEIHDLMYPKTNYGVGEVLISNDNIDYLGAASKSSKKYRITNSELITVLSSTQISKEFKVKDLIIDVLYDEVNTSNGLINILNVQYQNTYNKFLNDIKSLCMSKVLKWTTYHMYKEYFHNVSYSYAITIHKAQGSGFDNVAVYYNDINSFFNSNIKVNLFYTALTRTRHICYIIVD